MSHPNASSTAHEGADFVDALLAQWRQQDCPTDISPMRISARLLRLAALLDRDMLPRFRQHGLQNGEFDVLSALYRSGPPYALHPQQLTRQLLLSSSALTYRLDALEKRALIARTPNPDDRRSIFVSLTDAGRHTMLAALQTYMQTMQQAIAPLNAQESEQLEGLLRKLLRHQAED